MRNWERFKDTKLGRRLRPIIEDRENIRDMVALSRHDIPAVMAIGKQVMALGPDVKDSLIKQTIGRWVREVLAKEGMVPIRSGRVSPGNLFTTGTIYGWEKKK